MAGTVSFVTRLTLGLFHVSSSLDPRKFSVVSKQNMNKPSVDTGSGP